MENGRSSQIEATNLQRGVVEAGTGRGREAKRSGSQRPESSDDAATSAGRMLQRSRTRATTRCRTDATTRMKRSPGGSTERQQRPGVQLAGGRSIREAAAAGRAERTRNSKEQSRCSRQAATRLGERHSMRARVPRPDLARDEADCRRAACEDGTPRVCGFGWRRPLTALTSCSQATGTGCLYPTRHHSYSGKRRTQRGGSEALAGQVIKCSSGPPRPQELPTLTPRRTRTRNTIHVHAVTHVLCRERSAPGHEVVAQRATPAAMPRHRYPGIDAGESMAQ